MQHIEQDDETTKAIKKQAMQMNLLIITLAVFIIGLFFAFPFAWWIRLGAIGLVAVSLYYQLMAYHYGVGSADMIGMKIQERMINEMGYQASKRGYKILFKYVFEGNEEKVKVLETDIPSTFRRKVIKWISVFHVVLKPAWGYREYDEEDDIDEALNDSWQEMRDNLDLSDDDEDWKKEMNE